MTMSVRMVLFPGHLFSASLPTSECFSLGRRNTNCDNATDTEGFVHFICRQHMQLVVLVVNGSLVQAR